jgi:curli biogenesis system outer membrane secretion channel CsgG
MFLRFGSGALLVAALAGCCCFGGRPPAPETKSGMPNVSVQADSQGIRKVAVMPFRAQNELVGAAIADYFVGEILGSRQYELVERSQIGRVLSESELALSGISDSKAAEVGSMVGADGVVIGTVGDYEMVTQNGTAYAVVGISARMIDARNGKIVWSVDLARRAEDPKTTLSEHARHVVHDMMQELGRVLRNPRQ